MRKKKVLLFMLFVVAFTSLPLISHADEKCTEVYGSGSNKFSLATGSPGELGLLRVLGETFGKEMDATLCWIKAGTGDSLALLKEKKTDMIMVHAPEAEKKAIAEGWAMKRTLIGSNEFYIVGPPDDPTRISEAQSAVDAYKRNLNFSQGEITREHTKKKWTYGKKPAYHLPVTGTLLQKIS